MEPDPAGEHAPRGSPDRRVEVPEPLRRFVRLFNRGEYWESHEVLEDPWREMRSPFYHGLILYASAFVHLQRENPHGIQAQLDKALEALSDLPPVHLGVDVEEIRHHARRIRRRVAAGGEASDPPRWSEVITVPRLDLDPRRIRGDEPELD